MSDIFISYASEDRDKAHQLAQALETLGWSVWWDRKIAPGKSFDKVIGEALDQARCVIVLWSRASVESDWVKEEAEEGARRDILVPALIEAVPPPLGFRRIQAANLASWGGDPDDADFHEFRHSISLLVETKPQTRDKPVRPAGAHPPPPKPSMVKRMLTGLFVTLIGGGAAWYFLGQPGPSNPPYAPSYPNPPGQTPAAPQPMSGGPINVSISASPPILTRGQQTTVNVYVQDSQGRPIPDAMVTLMSGGGRFQGSQTPTVSGPTSYTGSYVGYWSCDPCAPAYINGARVTKAGYTEGNAQWRVEIH